MKEIEKLLKITGIQPTATRLLIYQAIQNHNAPISLTELEILLDTVDKSTIFRALSLFTEKGILHELEDGSGSKKYCFCTHQENSNHISYVHFTCIKCHKTFCLDDLNLSWQNIPNEFSILEQSLLIKGICPQCNRNL